VTDHNVPVKVLRPEDRAMILSVGEQVWVNSDLMNSIANLESAIDSVGSRKNQVLAAFDPIAMIDGASLSSR
jgi:hypothetical protein